MSKQLIIVLEGASSLSLKKDDTMTEIVRKVAIQVVPDATVIKVETSDKTRNIIENVKSILAFGKQLGYDRITFVGKSLGGACLFWSFEQLLTLIAFYNKAQALFVDAHSTIFETFYNKGRPYGDKRDITLTNAMRNTVTSYCVYQKNKYPRGANIIGAVESIKLDTPDIDHFSIVHSPAVDSYIRKIIT
jgi:hypothetical protein